eukprot:2409831-Amphidinium_carterae.1
MVIYFGGVSGGPDLRQCSQFIQSPAQDQSYGPLKTFVDRASCCRQPSQLMLAWRQREPMLRGAPYSAGACAGS